MGINVDNRRVLADHVFPLLPVGFTVYELGDQVVRAEKEYPARKLYEAEGCGDYDCLDMNGGESLRADLNYQLKLKPRDLVTDFGTSEHVFNIYQCWKNIHDMLDVSGLIVYEKITQGNIDHGFYNLQPTFFTSLAYANDYRIIYSETTKHNHASRIRGVLQKQNNHKFVIPVQDRYRSMLGAV